MKKIILNIGLNVGNIEPNSQLNKTLQRLIENFHQVTNLKIVSGEWEGIVERTLVVEVLSFQKNTSYLRLVIEKMAMELQQDAIAYKIDGVGILAFNPEYNKGLYQFNEQYFINI